METTKIGWLGLGKMGVPMVKNLIAANYKITVYNRSKSALNEFKNQNIAIASSAKELLKNNDVVILMVADDAAITSIFEEDEGLLQAKVSGKIIINMSTVSAQISEKMASLLAKNNNEYLDAPVSGSLKQATEATLVIMAGGKQEIFDKVAPIFNHLAKLALRVGAVGAGNSAKLAINALLSFYALGLAEAVTFGQQKGIETSTLLTLINNSALGNPFTKIKGDAIENQNFNPVFALKHIVKDLQLAKHAGIDSPLANIALQTFTNAQSDLGEEDIIAIYKKL